VPPSNVPVTPPPPLSPVTPPTTANSVGSTIYVNGYPLIYSVLGSFSEFLAPKLKTNVTIPSLAGRNVQFVGFNVRCGSSVVSGASYSQQVKLQAKTGYGVFDFSQIGGGESLKLCVQQTDLQWARFSDIALQTVTVSSVRYNAAVAAAAVTASGTNKREITSSVLVPRQQAVYGISLRTTPTMQVGDSFSFATSESECANGPSDKATDITTVGASKLDFSQIPSRTVLSPCIKKAGFSAWLFYPNQVIGVVEPDTISFRSANSLPSESGATTVVGSALVIMLNVIIVVVAAIMM